MANVGRKKAAGASTGAKPRKPAKNAHPLAVALPEGEVLKDSCKQCWKLGKPIGSGGFGLIYLTAPDSPSPVSADAEYCMKLEPLDNGPLFCECHFYLRAAKPEKISTWMASHHVKSLGVPKFIANGQYETRGSKYRFLVMQRFGTDLQKLFEASGKRFAASDVFLVGHKMLDVLEYIHEQEYVHADVKASNLLLGFRDPHEVYLVDYGLATKYTAGGPTHKEYKEDPRKAHDGTIEFTSRDAHKGVAPSRRGDLEILGYCLLQWLCSRLPWEDNLNNKEYVRDQKMKYMADISGLMTKCFGKEAYPEQLKTYLQYVTGLGYTETPDYEKCRQLFAKALAKLGHSVTDRLMFDVKPAPVAKGSKRKSPSSGDGDAVLPSGSKVRKNTASAKQSASNTVEPPLKISKKAIKPVKKSSSDFMSDDSMEFASPVVAPVFSASTPRINAATAVRAKRNAAVKSSTPRAARKTASSVAAVPTNGAGSSSTPVPRPVIMSPVARSAMKAAASQNSAAVTAAKAAVRRSIGFSLAPHSSRRPGKASAAATASAVLALNTSVAHAGLVKKRRHRDIAMTSMSTQTSPGLRGLPRSQKNA